MRQMLIDANYTRFMMPHPTHGGTNDFYSSPRHVALVFRLLNTHHDLRNTTHHDLRNTRQWRAPWTKDHKHSLNRGLERLGLRETNMETNACGVLPWSLCGAPAARRATSEP